MSGSLLELFAEFSTAAVIIGLVIEYVSPAIAYFKTPWYERATACSAVIHALGPIFVVGGIAGELYFHHETNALQESIIDKQQSKIISLETRLAVRVLSELQIAKLRQTLAPLGSQSFQMETYWEATEPETITKQIGDRVLIPNGWQFVRSNARLVGVIAGVLVFEPRGDAGKPAAKALVEGLVDNGIDAKLLPNADIEITDIEVGIKP